MTPLKTVEQVAEHLQLNPHTIYRAVRRNELKAIRIGNKIRISDDDLAAYLSTKRTAQSLIRKVGA